MISFGGSFGPIIGESFFSDKMLNELTGCGEVADVAGGGGGGCGGGDGGV